MAEDKKSRACHYLQPQEWWFADKTPIESVFLMMSSAETMKWKSAGWTRYSKYSKAKTIGEAFELGATRADIKYQVERGNMRLRAPNKATQKKYEQDLEKKAGGDDGWREARIAHKGDLKTLENSPEYHVSRGSIVENLGKVHADAGLRGLRRATPAMPCFTLVNAAGDTIHSTSHEGHEQLVATWCLSASDCVLEIGGGIGAASTMIQKIISDKKGHVVVEPQPKMCETLERNKTLQGSGFFVAKGALAKGNVYAAKKAALDGPDTMTQRQWMFHKTSRKQTASTSLVKSWDLKTLREKVAPRKFTAVVVDCEGAFPDVVDDFPDIFEGIRVVYLERDGESGTDYSRVDAALEKANLALVLAASKHRVYVKATAADLKKRDAEKSRRLNNRVDAKTAASYRGERASSKKRVEANVGRRLKVWWPKDSAWYAGTITAFNGRTKHTITYDDGETEVLNLSKETTRFLPSKRKVEEDSDGEEVVTSKPRTARQVALATK